MITREILNRNRVTAPINSQVEARPDSGLASSAFIRISSLFLKKEDTSSPERGIVVLLATVLFESTSGSETTG